MCANALSIYVSFTSYDAAGGRERPRHQTHIQVSEGEGRLGRYRLELRRCGIEPPPAFAPLVL